MFSFWLGVAMAFQPTTDDQGIEPQRVQRTHPQVQAQHHFSDAFRAWTRDAGPWNAQFDEVTGRPLAMWGRGVPMPADADGIGRALKQVVGRHADLFGTEGGEVVVRSAEYVDRLDTWYVELDVLRNGLPTYRSGISARIKHGNLVLLRVATHPDVPVVGELVLDGAQAIRRAIEGGKAPGAEHTDAEVEPMLLERTTPHGLELVTTWQVRTRTKTPPGIWVAFVDATTGEVLNVHNEVRFITGTVSGEHPPRTLDGSPYVTSPMPLIYVGNGSDTFADHDGVYTLAGNAPVESVLEGEYLRVVNTAGPDGYLSSNSGDPVWTDASATQAEISSYVFLHHVYDWGQEVAPEVSVTSFYGSTLTSFVNINDVCNAYFDGNVNFFQSGFGCNNTGEIADVNYHEWGHGFHAFSLRGGVFDGSLSEGAADVVSFLLTGDNLIAPFFGTNGSAIRNVAPNMVYPQDYVDNPYFVHSNGLIFGGAMWDLWGALIDAEGVDVGTASTEDIFSGLLKGGPDIPASVYEALVADDDDGNLENGTPHSCAIIEAFGTHGLGVQGIGTSFVPFHEPLASIPADQPNALRLEVLASAAECIDLANASGSLHYRIDNGSWQELAAVSVDSTLVEAELPALPAGTFVEYWFEGVDGDGAAFASPSVGQAAPFSTYVGDTLDVRCFSFEADDGGFTHELLAGSVSDGADDWQWGMPGGQSFDPSQAFSGNNVWANDLGQVVNGQPYNGAYQADKTNRLSSPRLETDHYTGVFLQYRRWLQVEDGLYDQARIYADDDVVWSNWVSAGGEEHHLDGLWVSHSVDLDGQADRGGITLGWELQSDQGLEFGGWTIDDVCLMAPDTVDNRLPVLDLNAAVDGEGRVTLSFTSPGREPFTRLRIVRNDSGFPTNADDGTIVYDKVDPVPGGNVTVIDDNPTVTPGFYAVYTGDDTAWLSWTEEGWNAAATDASAFAGLEPRPTGTDGTDGTDATTDATTADSTEAGKDGEAGGCGCTTATPAGAFGPLLLLGLLGLRRRR